MTQCRALASLSGCVNPVSAGLGFKVEALYKSRTPTDFRVFVHGVPGSFPKRLFHGALL